MEKRNREIDISKYLRFLQKQGWSDLIDERWKDDVKNELLEKYPKMKDDEWEIIDSVLFFR